MTLKIAIVDDELMFLDYIQQIVHSYFASKK